MARKFGPWPEGPLGMSDLIAELGRLGLGTVQGAVPLSRHTSFRIGGPARVMIWPQGPAEVATLLSWLSPREEFFVLGRGSNLLVAEAGYPGVVVNLRHLPADLRFDAGGVLKVSASYPVSRLAREARRHGLVGLEFLSGIPGSLGGAVAMNAGAHGSEIGAFLGRAFLADGVGQTREMGPAELGFGYRESRLPAAGILLEAWLQLAPGDAMAAAAAERSFFDRRRATQPWQWPSAGSVFRNPAGASAGRLIEQVGGKGRREGGAEISPEHANFIVNRGGAKATEVLALMRWARESVFREFGLALRPEIRFLGFTAADLAWLAEGAGHET